MFNTFDLRKQKICNGLKICIKKGLTLYLSTSNKIQKHFIPQNAT